MITELRIRDGVAAKLEEADLGTLGALSDRMATYGTTWNNGVKGIGEKAAEEVSDALAAFWGLHPELCEPETADAPAGPREDE